MTMVSLAYAERPTYALRWAKIEPIYDQKDFQRPKISFHRNTGRGWEVPKLFHRYNGRNFGRKYRPLGWRSHTTDKWNYARVNFDGENANLRANGKMKTERKLFPVQYRLYIQNSRKFKSRECKVTARNKRVDTGCQRRRQFPRGNVKTGPEGGAVRRRKSAYQKLSLKNFKNLDPHSPNSMSAFGSEKCSIKALLLHPL